MTLHVNVYLYAMIQMQHTIRKANSQHVEIVQMHGNIEYFNTKKRWNVLTGQSASSSNYSYMYHMWL